MLTTDLITTRAQFAALEGAWTALTARTGSPLDSHAWYAACAEGFTRDGDLRVFIARDEGGLRAAAPLVKDRSGALPRLRLLGFQAGEPQALPHTDREALAAVCAAVLRAGLALDLPRLPADSQELSVLTEAARGAVLPVLRPGSTSAYRNPIFGDWRSFEAAMSSKQRTELRRRRKKLEELGHVAFEASAPVEAEVQAPLEAFFAVEGTGWKRRNGTALSQDPQARAMFEAYARRAARQGLLRLFFLRLDGRVVAGQLHVQFGGRLWALKIGFDETLAKHAPGALLTHEVLRYGCDNGLQAFEHLGGAEEWQRRWPTEEQRYTTVRLYPLSASGGAALTADTLDFVRRRAGKLRTSAAPAPTTGDAARAA